MKSTISVCEKVQVRLTGEGRKLWLDYNTKPVENPAEVTDANDVVCVPLWELMRVFGPELKLSLKRGPLFEKDQVELKW